MTLEFIHINQNGIKENWLNESSLKKQVVNKILFSSYLRLFCFMKRKEENNDTTNDALLKSAYIILFIED